MTKQTQPKTFFQRIRKLIIPIWAIAVIVHLGYKGQVRLHQQEVERSKNLCSYITKTFRQKDVPLSPRDRILAKSGKLNDKCHSAELIPESGYINVATSQLLSVELQPERQKPWVKLFQKHFPGYSLYLARTQHYTPFKGAFKSEYDDGDIHETVILAKFNKSNKVVKIVVPRLSYKYHGFKGLPELLDCSDEQVKFLKDFLNYNRKRWL